MTNLHDSLFDFYKQLADNSPHDELIKRLTDVLVLCVVFNGKCGTHQGIIEKCRPMEPDEYEKENLSTVRSYLGELRLQYALPFEELKRLNLEDDDFDDEGFVVESTKETLQKKMFGLVEYIIGHDYSPIARLLTMLVETIDMLEMRLENWQAVLDHIAKAYNITPLKLEATPEVGAVIGFENMPPGEYKNGWHGRKDVHVDTLANVSIKDETQYFPAYEFFEGIEEHVRNAPPYDGTHPYGY